jgi:hypothetical protein
MKIAIPSELRKAFCSLISRRWILVLLILSPAIFEAIYIKIFGVNVVFWDQWSLVHCIEKLYTNNISFNDLFQQHNEHRLFFPKIIMLFLVYISNYNNIYEMYFSWILALFILLLVFLMYKNSFGTSTKMIIYFLPISFLIFSLRQFENILWGFQLQVYLCVLGFLISVYMLEKSDKLGFKFFLAAFGGVFASYSFANGLAAWPAGLFFILFSNKGKKMALVWSLIGLLAAGLFFYHWEKPQGHPSTLFIIEQPVKGLIYFLANIGSPLAFKISIAVGFGIILMGLLSVELFILIKYGALKENAKWLSLILFSLISSFALTIFRAGFGIEQAGTSRYVTITLLAIVGIYCLALNIYNNNSENKIRLFLLRSLLLILIIGLIGGNMYGLAAGPYINVLRTDSAYYLKTYEQQTDDNLRNLYPDPAAVREMAPILKKYKLNVFSNDHINPNETNDSLNESSMKKINSIIQKYISRYK